MSISYDEISKTQKTIEDQFAIIEKGFAEARKVIESNRIKILSAINAQQQDEAAKLAVITDSLKSLITPLGIFDVDKKKL